MGRASTQPAQPDQRFHHHEVDRKGGDAVDVPGQSGESSKPGTSSKLLFAAALWARNALGSAPRSPTEGKQTRHLQGLGGGLENPNRRLRLHHNSAHQFKPGFV
jgi:hypothetical protein